MKPVKEVKIVKEVKTVKEVNVAKEVKIAKEVKKVKEVKIVREVKRSDSLWRFACGDVLDLCSVYIFSPISVGFHSNDVPLSVQISVPPWRKICDYRQNIDLS